MLAIHSRDQPSILPGRDGLVATTTAGEQELTRPFVRGLYVVIDRLTGLLGELEPDRPARLRLTDGCAIDGLPVRSNVLQFQANDIAPPQFTIGGRGYLGQLW